MCIRDSWLHCIAAHRKKKMFIEVEREMARYDILSLIHIFFYSRIVILFRKQREANLRMEYKTDSLLVHLSRAGDEDACEKLVLSLIHI